MSNIEIDLAAIEVERQRIRNTYLRPEAQRSASSARGVHHTALLCSDVERTVRFYQDVLEFPLTDIFENRDYKGSNHFFFDIGTGTCWRSSTSPAWTWDRTPRCSAGSITSRSRWSPRHGSA